ncbi:MAG: hypothetical protein JWN18_584 [Parcubacteria group bacterium]|nr:hypothetical protein [Parcubacteria group bacterium]
MSPANSTEMKVRESVGKYSVISTLVALSLLIGNFYIVWSILDHNPSPYSIGSDQYTILYVIPWTLIIVLYLIIILVSRKPLAPYQSKILISTMMFTLVLAYAFLFLKNGF